MPKNKGSTDEQLDYQAITKPGRGGESCSMNGDFVMRMLTGSRSERRRARVILKYYPNPNVRTAGPS